ncbi:MAG: CusA/CzcA family heavy metal efflux RND transporter [Flavobacteriaceae bacterium]|nr:CusA/CzcA family heavy metal efflux RND transporter [Flavobacteriaceae bacterium]
MKQIIRYSLQNKLIILLFTAAIVGFGIYAAIRLPIGAVPDITNNQVQVITTSRNLSTLDVEKFLTYPVELEMTNLPGVKEIRSVSKFGLSVVTVVFEENMGTYLPRQLIAEKLKTAEENIPQGFGTPFMGPISTGLGEIYQYILDVEPEYEDKYTTTDLRSIQDWIVLRQLSGIDGVVEVNTWGGFLKQYEVAVNPNRLRSMNISLEEIYQALESNNSIAGGGYIEKGNEAFFIRGEGLANSLDDIKNIVVSSRNGIPIYIRDVAQVGFGHATRFGAITGNGEGEKVLGQVMMLKDANTKTTINNVKKRVAEIEKSLPPGVHINPFLERSELLNKTTFTISENLILGCLIVIFVVVLLLGNLRSGLVVASVIPLSLLFALGLMHIFKVDANLMSLGAIDFGIIIDGAVIIVEFIAFQINTQLHKITNLPSTQRRSIIDKITEEASYRMMHSAFFGQIIILIVFIPILSLSGVEGKMFRPMALVFSFALVGAIILCFTWVPVISSLVLKPQKSNKKNISNRLIRWIQDRYKPTIFFALRNKKAVLASSVLLLIIAFFIFSKMGGEFVPTLDEGDFVIQPVYKTGTSLEKTIELATEMELILKEFPEVNQVVTRIGAAEVPTDPMSMEETDVIITLFPKKNWTTASTKDGLADAFKEAIQNKMPGVEIEFTQPIEMRFNELITGVRSDLAIKVFGEDLDVLYKKANEIEKAIANVPGAADILVEKIAGLPEMSVTYNRNKIAMYGLNIADVNDVLQAGFGGKTAGRIFEGEKQFDLVVRYDASHRRSIENLRNAFVTSPTGMQIPLSELAEINYTKGPAQISRDEAKRRVVVGVNVRNRDLESVVNDVKQIVNDQIDIPTGYNIEYGGQFENLRSARNRLLVAVPIALLLIFILLNFAFDSIKDALLIFTAIPFSAVGGIFFLWLRGMHFSISAGVGFIALFGIAVLNGIVLIEHFKELKEQGYNNLHRRIITGTRDRMRPVLLTATAAALGFFPMAISTSAGAEVQKPLATVVIGGLVTSTMLTLIVLPVLYSIFDSKKIKMIPKKAVITVLFLGGSISLFSQSKNLQEMQEIAIENNLSILAQKEKVKADKALIQSTNSFQPTDFYYNFDQANRDMDNKILHVAGVSQSMKWPSYAKAQKALYESKAHLSESEIALLERQIMFEIAKSYYGIRYTQEVEKVYQTLDSLYERFAYGAQRKFELGESNNLEKITAQAKRQELAVKLKQIQIEREKFYFLLQQWQQTPERFLVDSNSSVKVEVLNFIPTQHPYNQYLEQSQKVLENTKTLQQKEKLPDLHGEVFSSINNLFSKKPYSGFQVGVGIPLWGNKAVAAQVESTEIEMKVLEYQKENFEKQLNSRFNALQQDIQKYEEAIHYYEDSGKNLASEILRSANLAYKNGEIDFLEFAILLDNAKQIEINYLENLNLYNQSVIELNYLN